MSRKYEALSPVSSWSNGRKAVVSLLQTADGAKIIRKVYRRGFFAPMCREYLIAVYVARRLSITPRVVGFRPWKKEILLEYLPGERVLEWVLSRFGVANLNIGDFQSFHGLDPPHNVDSRVAEAFSRFRQSTAAEAERLKHAIRESYASLHRVGVKHGSADPRNILYDKGRIFIIDFDNARPSFNAAKIDYEELEYWYGIHPG